MVIKALRTLSLAVLVVALAIAVAQQRGLVAPGQLVGGLLQHPAVGGALRRLRAVPLLQTLLPGPVDAPCSCTVRRAACVVVVGGGFVSWCSRDARLMACCRLDPTTACLPVPDPPPSPACRDRATLAPTARPRLATCLATSPTAVSGAARLGGGGGGGHRGRQVAALMRAAPCPTTPSPSRSETQSEHPRVGPRLPPPVPSAPASPLTLCIAFGQPTIGPIGCAPPAPPPPPSGPQAAPTRLWSG